MNIKLKQILHDFKYCLTAGIILSCLISLIAWIIGGFTGRGNIPAMLGYVSRALFFTGSVFLFISSFQYLKGKFKNINFREAKAESSNSIENNYAMSSTLNEQRTHHYLRDKIYIFSYNSVFLFIAAVILMIGCVADLINYYL